MWKQTDLLSALKNYSHVSVEKSRIDRMHMNFKCCGSRGYTDWWEIQWCTTWIDPYELSVSTVYTVWFTRYVYYPPDCILYFLIFSILPHDATQSARYAGIATTSRLSVCPSVCDLSITLRHCDHIGWKSSKIMSLLVSLWCSLSVDPNITDLLQREHPIILTQRDPPRSWIVRRRHSIANCGRTFRE